MRKHLVVALAAPLITCRGGSDTAAPPDVLPPVATAPDGSRPHLSAASLLVADASGLLFHVATDGAVLGSFVPALDGLAGVAWDAPAGVAWVSSSDGGEPLLALTLDGAEVARVLPADPPRSRHGLHVASGWLVSMVRNANSIDVVQYVDPSTGLVGLETGLFDGGAFLDGLWGLHVPNEASVTAALWTTRGPDLVRWDGAAAHVVTTPASELRGLTLQDDGTLWAIDAGSGELWHLDAAGTVLQRLDAPGPTPADLAWVPSS